MFLRGRKAPEMARGKGDMIGVYTSDWDRPSFERRSRQIPEIENDPYEGVTVLEPLEPPKPAEPTKIDLSWTPRQPTEEGWYLYVRLAGYRPERIIEPELVHLSYSRAISHRPGELTFTSGEPIKYYRALWCGPLSLPQSAEIRQAQS